MAAEILESTIAHYDDNAHKYAAQYLDLSPYEVFADTLHIFPTRSSIILDVGAGSGRDAVWLAGQGHTVIAVEPSATMRATAQMASPLWKTNVFWVDDRLPELSSVKAPLNGFDFILCSGVLMHLAAEDRVRAYRRMASLSGPNTTALMTMKTGGNNEGRPVFAINAAYEMEMAIDAGFRYATQRFRSDTRRPDVKWISLELRK